MTQQEVKNSIEVNLPSTSNLPQISLPLYQPFRRNRLSTLQQSMAAAAAAQAAVAVAISVASDGSDGKNLTNVAKIAAAEAALVAAAAFTGDINNESIRKVIFSYFCFLFLI